MAVEDKDQKTLPLARSTEPERNVRGHPAHSTETERNVRGHPETNFLPPLKMVLSFFDKEARQKKKKKDKKQKNPDEKNVEKLIEKLSEDEEENNKK